MQRATSARWLSSRAVTAIIVLSVIAADRAGMAPSTKRDWIAWASC